MPDSSSSTMLASVRESVEALSLEVALRDFSSTEQLHSLALMLADVERQAELAGMTTLAEMASSIPNTEPEWHLSLIHI